LRCAALLPCYIVEVIGPGICEPLGMLVFGQSGPMGAEDKVMKRKRFSAEQIVGVLKLAGVPVANLIAQENAECSHLPGSTERYSAVGSVASLSMKHSGQAYALAAAAFICLAAIPTSCFWASMTVSKLL